MNREQCRMSQFKAAQSWGRLGVAIVGVLLTLGIGAARVRAAPPKPPPKPASKSTIEVPTYGAPWFGVVYAEIYGGDQGGSGNRNLTKDSRRYVLEAIRAMAECGYRTSLFLHRASDAVTREDVKRHNAAMKESGLKETNVRLFDTAQDLTNLLESDKQSCFLGFQRRKGEKLIPYGILAFRGHGTVGMEASGGPREMMEIPGGEPFDTTLLGNGFAKQGLHLILISDLCRTLTKKPTDGDTSMQEVDAGVVLVANESMDAFVLRALSAVQPLFGHDEATRLAPCIMGDKIDEKYSYLSKIPDALTRIAAEDKPGDVFPANAITADARDLWKRKDPSELSLSTLHYFVEHAFHKEGVTPHAKWCTTPPFMVVAKCSGLPSNESILRRRVDLTKSWSNPTNPFGNTSTFQVSRADSGGFFITRTNTEFKADYLIRGSISSGESDSGFGVQPGSTLLLTAIAERMDGEAAQKIDINVQVIGKTGHLNPDWSTTIPILPNAPTEIVIELPVAKEGDQVRALIVSAVSTTTPDKDTPPPPPPNWDVGGRLHILEIALTQSPSQQTSPKLLGTWWVNRALTTQKGPQIGVRPVPRPDGGGVRHLEASMYDGDPKRHVGMGGPLLPRATWQGAKKGTIRFDFEKMKDLHSQAATLPGNIAVVFLKDGNVIAMQTSTVQKILDNRSIVTVAFNAEEGPDYLAIVSTETSTYRVTAVTAGQ